MSAPEIRPLITELEQGTIIGSSRILSCGDMLQLLETRLVILTNEIVWSGILNIQCTLAC